MYINYTNSGHQYAIFSTLSCRLVVKSAYWNFSRVDYCSYSIDRNSPRLVRYLKTCHARRSDKEQPPCGSNSSCFVDEILGSSNDRSPLKESKVGTSTTGLSNDYGGANRDRCALLYLISTCGLSGRHKTDRQ